MNARQEPLTLPPLPPGRLAVIESKKLLAKARLAKTLLEYWSNPAQLAVGVKPQPVDLFAPFRTYAEAVFNAYGQQYQPDFADGQAFENFLNRRVSQAVIQDIVPTAAPPSERLVIGLDEDIEQFAARLPFRPDRYSPGFGVPQQMWERLLEQTWWDRGSRDPRWPGFAGWITHPFIWALRARRNREILSEDLASMFRLRTGKLRSRLTS
jgi:hypothetical protein